MSSSPIAYGYGRVSTGKQEVSIEGQAHQVKAFYDYRLKDQGVAWGGWFQDTAVSGATKFKSRTAGAALCERLQAGDHVIFAKMDRAFRSAMDQGAVLEWMLKKEVKPHFLDAGVDASTNVGQMVLGILAHVAQWERSRIGERVRAANAERRRRGELAGPKPRLGFKLIVRGGKRYAEPDPAQLLTLKRIWEWQQQGHTIQDIRTKLLLGGVSMRGRANWTHDRVWECGRAYGALLTAGTLPDWARPELG